MSPLAKGRKIVNNQQPICHKCVKSSRLVFNVLQYASWVWPECRLCNWNVQFFSYGLFKLDGQDCRTEFQSQHGHGPYLGQPRSSDKKCTMHSVIYVHQPEVTNSSIAHLWCICKAVELHKPQFSKANQPKTSVDCNFGQFRQLILPLFPSCFVVIIDWVIAFMCDQLCDTQNLRPGHVDCHNFLPLWQCPLFL